MRNKSIHIFVVIKIKLSAAVNLHPISFRTHYSAVKCGLLTAD